MLSYLLLSTVPANLIFLHGVFQRVSEIESERKKLQWEVSYCWYVDIIVNTSFLMRMCELESLDERVSLACKPHSSHLELSVSLPLNKVKTHTVFWLQLFFFLQYSSATETLSVWGKQKINKLSGTGTSRVCWWLACQLDLCISVVTTHLLLLHECESFLWDPSTS